MVWLWWKREDFVALECSNTLFVGKETSSNLTSEGQLLSIAREKKLRLLLLLLFIRT